MTGQPFFSIVTPSFNQAAYLGEALQSVHSQHYPAHEHIVLDAASTDDSPNLLRRIHASAAGTHLIYRSHPDGGQSAALNEGFAQAQGDIIGWLNADDRYRPDCFQQVAGTFARHPEIDILYGDYTLISPTGRDLALRREIDFNHFILKYHRVLYIPTTATFFRRRIFDDGHFLRDDLHYAMDLDFFLRLAAAGYRFQHLSRTLADFRVHPASKSTRFIHRQRAEHRSIVLESTPLAHRLPSLALRNAAASLLQIPAALLRYSEKLLSGYYFNDRGTALLLQEKLQSHEERP